MWTRTHCITPGRSALCFVCLFAHKIQRSGCNHLQPVEADMGPGKNTKRGREPSFLWIFHQNDLTWISHHPWTLFIEQEYLLKKTQPHQRDRVQLYDVYQGENIVKPPVSLAEFLKQDLFQIHPREIIWHQPTLRYLTIVDNHFQQLNTSNVVVRISCFKSLLGRDQADSWVWFFGCWQTTNTNVKVVAKLQTEVMNALNSTFTEADWPKGTKKGDESFFSEIWQIYHTWISGWPSNFDGYISPGWCTAK